MKTFNTLILIVLCLLFSTLTYADVVVSDVEPLRDPFFTVGVALENGPSVNAPLERIDPFSGNLSIVQTDIELPGNGGLDLKIMRFYSSAIWGRRDEPYAKQVVASNEKSPLGIGWNMHMGIVLNPNGVGSDLDSFSGAIYDNPILELPDGSQHVFYKKESGLFVSTDMWIFKRISGTGYDEVTPGVWEVVSPEGVIYTVEYDNNAGYVTRIDATCIAQVTKIENPSQTASITIEYDIYAALQSSVNYSYLKKITDSTGRVIDFSYDDDRRLSSISSVGLTYTYDYDTSQLAVNSYFYFLTKVQPNVGTPWEYDYDLPESVSLADSGYQLIGMDYPTGGRVEYTYKDELFDTGAVDVEFSVVDTKNLYDRAGTKLGTWSYLYVSGSTSGAITTVGFSDRVDPTGSIIETYSYYDWGGCPEDDCDGTVWKIGRPLKTEIKNYLGTTLESTEYTWGQSTSSISSDNISNANWNYQGATFTDTEIYIPLLTQEVTTRNGRSYTTNYSDFDSYGNPQTISETGHKSRTRSLTYWTNADKNIVLGKVDLETVSGSLAGSFSIDNEFWDDGRLRYAIRYGVRTDYGYDSNGNVNSIKDANQNTTTFVWDKGRIQTISKPISGYTISRVINSNGTIASEKNGRDYTTNYEYDGNLRLTKIDPPGLDESQGPSADPANDTTITYSPDSSTRTVTRGGFVTTNSYDGFGRLTSTSDSTGMATSATYAPYGYKLSTSSNIGDKTDFDFFGRPTKVTHLSGVNGTNIHAGDVINYAYTEPLAGSQVTVTDEAGHPTVYTYNSFGNPDEQLLMSVLDANNTKTSYLYNILGS